MTNNIRVFLWLGLALALWLNYSQWQQDYGPKPSSATSGATNGANPASKVPSLADTVPQVAQATQPATTPAAGSLPATTPPEAATDSAGVVHVKTDVLYLDIDLKGGTLVRATLPAYPIVKGKPELVVLFNQDAPDTNYVLQSGLLGNTNAARRPTHLETYASDARDYELAPGQDELRVPLTWTDGNGVRVTKTFVVHRSLFTVGLEYRIDNQSPAPWVARSYARIVRTDPAVERSMFNVESYQFRGPAIWAPDKAGGDNYYRRLKLENSGDIKIPAGVQQGWLAGMQHHFVTAIVPDAKKKYDFTLDVTGRQYILGALGPAEVVAPNTSATLHENLFVGPKLQKQLVTLHPQLDRVADYGKLTILSGPLFALLGFLHSIVKNWGLAIMLATFLLKLAFYPLSEKAGRSMARMRSLAPRMKILQEQYKDDRTKLGQATMDLYKTEKVNPVAGCLPMIIQMPVFLAFYWVLLESVEMRQAPFFGWINDLSSRDPFFILPVLNGLAMWGQYKLNPPPPDPMQAKLFQFMPVVFSVMFAFFPAGLVLYWVTNTGLSILQQWNINRRIAVEDKARRK
jgi:YidC/Oxa1 family membrane protein insertase